MIIGLWHPGSGLGDQLFCYLAARITAKRLDVPFTMVGEFKGRSFISLSDFQTIEIPHHVEMPAGKILLENYWPIYEGETCYDPEFNFIQDNTIVDGCRCQDERYWQDWRIWEWIKTEPVEVPDDLCIIGFRGGEYSVIPELFLPKDYYVEAMARIRRINPNIRFRVVTDDPQLAHTCFPHLEITHELSMDWRQIRYAKYAIIANSAFYILPRWIRHRQDGAVTVAPRYWARRNIKEWSTPQNFYKGMTYI